MTKYSDLLRDPRWQKKRLEILNRDEWTCRECGDTKTTLHVHHCYYTRGNDPWEYPNESLVTLCEPCHGYETPLVSEARAALFEAIAKRGMRATQIKQFADMLASKEGFAVATLVMGWHSRGHGTNQLAKGLAEMYAAANSAKAGAATHG